ncbi:MAG: hypothetical protein U0T74_08605 [Chitinophagales bacterium]
MKKIYFLMVVLTVLLKAQLANEITLNTSTKEVYLHLQDKDEITLPFVPQKVNIQFTDDNWNSLRIQVNKEGNRIFYVAADKSAMLKGDDEKNYIFPKKDDFQKGKITIEIDKDGNVKKVGSVEVKERKIDKEALYLKLILNKKKESVKTEGQNESSQFCDKAEGEQKILPLPSTNTDPIHITCNEPSTCCGASNSYCAILPICKVGGENNSKTIRYRVVYDQRNGSLTYLKLKRYIVCPKENAYIQLLKTEIKGEDTNAATKLDGIISDLESLPCSSMRNCRLLADFKMLQTILNHSTNSKVKDAAIAQTITSIEYPYEYYKVKKQLMPRAGAEMQVDIIGKKDVTYSVEANGEDNYMEYQDKFAGVIEKFLTTAAPEKSNTDSPNVAATPLLQETDAIEKLKQHKANLLGVKNGIDEFNLCNAVIDFREQEYFRDLFRLRQQIAKLLNIEVSVNADLFKAALTKNTEEKFAVLTTNKEYVEYIDDLCKLIDEVYLSYNTAVSKKSDAVVFSKQIRVPNNDEFSFDLKGKEKDKDIATLLSRDFMVRGGFKIDFSAGFYLHGLSIPNYKFETSVYRFYRTVDSSGVPVNRIIDTVGTILRHQEKENKPVNYGFGVFAHFYSRTGTFVNFGGAVGLMLDNNTNVSFLLGGSLMFNVKKSRISFQTGLAVGKTKELAKGHTAEESTNTANTVHPNSYDLPHFYDSTAQLPLIDKWKPSWFAGISFNFATVAPANKADKDEKKTK